MLVCLEEEEGREYIEEVGEEVVIVPSLGHVPVLDSVDCLAAEEEKKGDHLLAAFSYWCQGKPGGCHIDSSLTACDQLRVRWHEEEDYNSREIPCPSYRHGALEKKFSECNDYSNWQKLVIILFAVPLENTCFIKTVVRGSWSEARSQCWD